jgi:hypothetical protein
LLLLLLLQLLLTWRIMCTCCRDVAAALAVLATFSVRKRL